MQSVRSLKKGIPIQEKRYSLDAMMVNLCLLIYPWAKLRTTKRRIKLPPHSIVVMEKAYCGLEML
jgi:hypothetical protein